MRKRAAMAMGVTILFLVIIAGGLFLQQQNKDGTTNIKELKTAESTDGTDNLEETENTDKSGEGKIQAVYTSAVPEQYFRMASQQGQIIQIEYETHDYTTTSNGIITKPAYVYLPYGYDEKDGDTRYDILYLMHGWGMTADNFFNSGMSQIVNMLDNLIEQEEIPPVIVVSATFDTENQPQDFSRSVNEIAVFHNDFRDDLMPYIESRFHTYAEGTTEDDFQNSREHRAFAGFSLGAVTTWYQFVYNLDCIKYFAPMSGDCWILGTYGGRDRPAETTEYLEDIVRDSGLKNDDFYIYSGIGTNDPIWEQVDNQMQEMSLSDIFTSENLCYAIKQDGRHDMDACEEYLYHALPIFFCQN